MQTHFTSPINADLDGLLYISESEAPVCLLQWPDIQTIADAIEKIATLNDTKPEDQTLQSVEDFRKPIERMAVPEDLAMQEYAKRWENVFKKMETGLQNIQVIITPVQDAQQQIYIVGFDDCGATALHTSAIVT